MKKYIFLIITASVAIFACNQASNQKPDEPNTITDTTKASKTADATEIMKVSELSAEELKDDSVFTDGSVPTRWVNAGITDVKGLKLFIKQLQQLIITNDKEKIASIIKYPINKTIKSKAELVANYDAIFTKEVQLSFATVNFNQLFRNAHGVMTNGGKVWINQKGKEFQIIAINP